MLLVGVLAGCGSAPGSIDTAALHLPVGRRAGELTRATLDTSPDGGIYRNPNSLIVDVVAPVDPAPFESRLGSAAEWRGLRALGRFVVVGLRIRNDGKGRSEPELRDLQLASDFAPPGAVGDLRRYYHPLFPLAAASDRPLTSACTIQLDPGETATALLLYPPIRSTSTVVWGQYGDFARRFPVGGALTDPPPRLRVSLCTRPQTAPAPS